MNAPRMLLSALGFASAMTLCLAQDSHAPRFHGWLSWRGPWQNGTSQDTGLPESVTLGGENHLWSYDLSGRGTPVIRGNRLYATGYRGEGKALQEVLVCLDTRTGKLVWEDAFSDFLTDVIYNRYAISSPVIDPETENVYFMTSAGLVNAYAADGKRLWQVCLMTEFGRLTFPNGRTGSILVFEDTLILHIISSSWGPDFAPARDRFYAFDKHTGENLWGATPGEGPKDSSFSYPVIEQRDGEWLIYAGTGCGNMVCLDARTGETKWRFKMSIGGASASAVLYGDHLIAAHGKENVDSSVIGRGVSIRLGAQPAAGQSGPLVLDKSYETWRNDDMVAFTSSPVLVGKHVFLTTFTGDLRCVHADTGQTLWHKKLGTEQIHASPAYAEGKLFVPMNDGNFWILRPSDTGVEVLDTDQLEGNCLGAPAIAEGNVYVHTTSKLYAFGTGKGKTPGTVSQIELVKPGPATRLQAVPADLVVRPGDRVTFRVRSFDAKGTFVDRDVQEVQWTLPPRLGLAFEGNTLVVARDTAFGTGVITAEKAGVKGSARIRVVPRLPYAEDFESAMLNKKAPDGAAIAFPPPHWIGAMKKWDIREVDGQRVLAKTLDDPLFQRCMSFFGSPDMKNYTVQVDVMTDGNRRIKSSAGVINQRYLIQLKGNYQSLEVSSNLELFKEEVPFRWAAKTWYTLKSRVDVQPDGSGIVRAKVWKRGDPEPEAWTIEVTHPHAHTQGSPGVFGFAPQSRFSVYLDNLSVTPNT
ncbi:MAG: PQQ-binding-like beta-propeller repeat protein [Planctomycetes bacterium]|nr:PQQ-binding-like beta-propeller repeat protein [Planctomycetota bacterium]